MRVVAATSTSPDVVVAREEVVARLVAELDGDPADLVVLFASLGHRTALADHAEALADALGAPPALVGGVAQGVVGADRELEDGPALTAWVAVLDGGEAAPFRTWAVRSESGTTSVLGWPDTRPDDVVVLLVDPFTYPVGDVLRRMSEERPGHAVVGGMVTGGPGGTGLVLGDQVHPDGAVGVVLRDVDAHVLVSQGCRPVGEPLTVTAAEGNVLLQLAGRPAVEVLAELLEQADEVEAARIQRGLQVGLVADLHRDEYEVGDFLVRGVLGIDRERGGVVVGDAVEVGQVACFHVRDADAAGADLHDRLAATVGEPTAGALLFTCNGRGSHLFGLPDHDRGVLQSFVDAPVSGAFCAGELGPVGDANHVHGFTASVLLLRGESDPSGT
ncbi:MAG: FIST N-terminal domain-containing protein [Actinomycetes bacterium]